MAKFTFGDLVVVNNYIHPRGTMVDDMLSLYGGRVVTISTVEERRWDDKPVGVYKILEDMWGYEFSDYDLTAFDSEKEKKNSEQQFIFQYICELFQKNSYAICDEAGEQHERIWSDGDMILCKNKKAIDIIASTLDSHGYTSVTGYYDPEEDKQGGTENEYTGSWYVTVD